MSELFTAASASSVKRVSVWQPILFQTCEITKNNVLRVAAKVASTISNILKKDYFRASLSALQQSSRLLPTAQW